MRNQFWLLLIPFAIAAHEPGLDLPQQKLQAIDCTREVQNPNHKSPEEIQAELDAAEAQFEKAKGMFNPWYTGPIVTPSASMMPPGMGNIQPYIYLTDNYARFNEDRHSVNLTHDLIGFKALSVVQTGLTNSVDLVTVPTVTANWQNGQSGGGFNDLSFILGFLVNKQSRYIPQVKFTIQETFPTGKYQNLSTNGLNLNATGGGAYSTQFGIVFGKLLFWTTQHPLNTRLFFAYQLSTTVHVRNFNNYGGGFGTNGTVRPGNQFSADLGLELSLTQNWVFATDIVYTFTERTTFRGNPGTNADGTTASVGSGFNDNLNLCPAIEYLWSPSLGIIAGIDFSVYGRNSLNFVQGIISLTYTFP